MKTNAARVAAYALSMIIGLCAATTASSQNQIVPGPHWSVDPARGELWNFVKQCLAAKQSGTPASGNCVRVEPDEGYVLLKDYVGVGQYQVVPSIPVTGIEDSLLWVVDGPNYWKIAWSLRYYVEDALKTKFRDSEFGLAVNSIYIRTQDQLHIHMDCVVPEVIDVLNREKSKLSTTKWTPLPTLLGKFTFRAKLIDDPDLSNTDPFRLLANEVLPGVGMLPETLFLTNTTLNGKRLFILLNDSADKAVQDGAQGDPNYGAAEFLLDHSCAVLQGH